MKSTRIWSLLGVLVLCLSWQTRAFATIVFDQKVPLDAVVHNLSTQEDVQVTGFLHILDDQHRQPDGSIVDITRTAAHAEGIGLTSGNAYVGNETDVATTVSAPGGGSTTTIPIFLRLVSLGKLPNELLRNIVTVTTDASGNVIVTQDISFECKGGNGP